MTNIHKSKLLKQLAALIYDIFPILGMFLVTSLLFIFLRAGKEVAPQTLWFQIILFLEVFFYFSYSWKKGGQTIGMKAWKIGISNHSTLTWPNVTLRFLTGLLSTIMLGAGLWYSLFNPKKLSWMDLACGQPVVDFGKKNSEQSDSETS